MNRPPITIRELHDGDLPHAIGVLGRGMRDNPGHTAAFGHDPMLRQRSLERMFSGLCSVMRTLQWLCAHDDTTRR